jgi:hypothetical protein
MTEQKKKKKKISFNFIYQESYFYKQKIISDTISAVQNRLIGPQASK